jgi:tRNA(Arg) A34 adenosine deaminase TadA
MSEAARARHVDLLRRAIELSKNAVAHGNTPFGALVTGPDGEVLLEQENVEVTESDCTGHAETRAAAAASRRYPKDFLAGCTLYTSAEPCAMCAGAIYWSNIGAVVFAITEAQLLTVTGDDPRNPTMHLPSATVLGSGQKKIELLGPFEEVEDAAVAVLKDFFGSR